MGYGDAEITPLMNEKIKT